MANESMFGVLGQATELRQRILFTLGALIVYRLGTYIPVPGINALALSEIVDNANNGVLGMFNMFSGGAVTRMAIFALGIMPYISSSIIVQLLLVFLIILKILKNKVKLVEKKLRKLRGTELF